MSHQKERRDRQAIPVNNLFAALIVMFMICSVLSSYAAYNRSRNITEELTGKVSAEARFCVNKAPAIYQSCNTTATLGMGYYCKANATDPDNDTITFYDDTSLFAIDPNTGEIIFTPSTSGTYNILLTAADGKGCSNSNATSLLTLTISGGGGAGGGGGGGGGGGVSAQCKPQWECTAWRICSPDGTTTRICTTLNNCLKDKPAESQGCIYLMPPAKKPREGVPQFYLCDFDQKDECFASFGMKEDWVYTYKAKDSTINIRNIAEDSADISIDDSILFISGLERIKAVDVTGDGVEDFEYILHRVVGGRAEMTVRKIKQVEVVVEKPVFIYRLPTIIIIILMFIYNYLCVFLLMLMMLAAMIVYGLIMRKVEDKNQK
jgi:hypothetical protein